MFDLINNVSYGETARMVKLLAILYITYYYTDQYKNWDELWYYSLRKVTAENR